MGSLAHIDPLVNCLPPPQSAVCLNCKEALDAQLLHPHPLCDTVKTFKASRWTTIVHPDSELLTRNQWLSEKKQEAEAEKADSIKKRSRSLKRSSGQKPSGGKKAKVARGQVGLAFV